MASSVIDLKQRVIDLKQKLIRYHGVLIEDLENKYQKRIIDLMQQKKNIIIQIQNEFYKQMEKVMNLEKSGNVMSTENKYIIDDVEITSQTGSHMSIPALSEGIISTQNIPQDYSKSAVTVSSQSGRKSKRDIEEENEPVELKKRKISIS